MERVVPKKDFTFDGIVWFFFICFLAMLSFSMMTRDSQKQYGALSFGVFPAFNALDQQGKNFDQHRLHGQLSAIIISDQYLNEDISHYLKKFSQVTKMGSKYLNSLVLTNQAGESSSQWLQYLILDSEDFKRIYKWQKNLFKDGIILVDQNGVIRGVFNLEDKLERMNFEGAVKGIL